MKRAVTFTLVATAMLGCGNAFAQARGPAADEVMENGQRFESNYRPTTELIGGWREIPIGELVPDAEISALGQPGELDEATRAAQLAQLETWLKRLPGRFRIAGRIEKPGTMGRTLFGEVTGIADCAELGEGIGVRCILNATWLDIEETVADISAEPPDSELLRTLQPAVLFVGLNLDPPGLRALLVTDDSLAHTWAGKLTESTLNADRLTDCRDNPADVRCLQPFEMIAAPDGGNVQIILRRFRREPVLSDYFPLDSPRTLTINITMVPDADAQLDKPMKTKKAR